MVSQYNSTARGRSHVLRATAPLSRAQNFICIAVPDGGTGAGTFTDGGQRLQVTGTGYFSNTLTVNNNGFFGTIAADRTIIKTGSIETYYSGTLIGTFGASIYINGGGSQETTIACNGGGSSFTIYNGTGTTKKLQLFSTGNLLLQNGGTFTDAGYRLDVNGTARVSGVTTISANSASGILVVTNSNTTTSISVASLLASGATGDTYFSVGRALTNNNSALIGHSTVGGGNYAFIAIYGRPASDFAVTSTGSIGIGTSSTNTSARLQVDSTTQGVLFPRMTTTEKTAIATPAAGLMVYDSTLNQMSYYNGTTWINF